MEITSEISSLISNAKEDFEKRFKECLVTDSLRQVITKSMPASEIETKRLNDPEFREKFNNILTPITREVIDKFENVGQFDTGNLFSSMVNSISESVSLESTYRENCAYNDIRLDRIDSSVESYVENRFSDLKFSSTDIGKRAVENFKIILSTEDANDILEDIKDEVKTAIDETEDKNKLIEGTTKEIIDYKKEIAPPEDQYENPENPDAGEEGQNDDSESGKEMGAVSDQGEEQDTSTQTGDDTNEEPQIGEEQPESENNNETTDDQNIDETANQNPPTDAGENPPVDNGETSGTTAEDDLDSPEIDVNSELGIDGETDNNADINVEGNTDTETSADSETTAEPEQKSEETPSQNQNSGIVINITGTDLAKAKESLSIKTAESFAMKTVPSHPRTFDEMKLPSVIDIASESCSVIGDINKEFNIQFDSLSYGIRQIGEAKSEEALRAKMDKLKTISTEAFKMAEGFKNSLYDIGLSSDGLVNSKENTFFCAANLIKMIAGTRKINDTVLPYNSTENVLANAFDVLQLRKECKFAVGEVDQSKADELYSREAMFYRNIAAIEDPELKKEAAAVIDLTDMKLEKALTTNFITDYKIKAWEVNVGKDANSKMNEVVTNRVKDSFEKLWGRELNDTEMEIIQAVTSGKDVTAIAPSPYEKFAIKLTKDAVFNAKSTEAVKFNLDANEKKNIMFKAKIYTTLVKACERFNILDANDEWAINEFCERLN